jgi:hypothetical protein
MTLDAHHWDSSINTLTQVPPPIISIRLGAGACPGQRPVGEGTRAEHLGDHGLGGGHHLIDVDCVARAGRTLEPPPRPGQLSDCKLVCRGSPSACS